MRAEPITERLWRMCRFGVANCYLVREDDGTLTLVDTMFRGSAPSILEAARPLGSIERIVLTHAHWDHVGAADALVAQLAGVQVFAGEREVPILRGDRSRRPDEAAGSMRGLVKVTVTPVAVAAGERIGSLEVVFAPGHTPGQIALLDVRDRTLLAADAYTTLGGVRSTGKISLPFPLPALVAWHRPTAQKTAAALAALQPSRLCVGHGRPVENPTAAMEAQSR